MDVKIAMKQDGIRINKYISECGICSRRKADELIAKGLVRVNDSLAEPGTKVFSDDWVYVNDKKIEPIETKVVLAYYKPKGLVCSVDGQGSKTVFEDINYPMKLCYVGRLDKDSEGLLLLTNDGELDNIISKAKKRHEKEYEVTVNRPVTKKFLRKMAEGVPILDTVTRPCEIHQTGECSFTIILTQGLNRQIRRMCEYCGYQVRKLKRVRILNIQLGNLKKGEYRKLTEQELYELYQLSGKSGSAE